MESSKPILDNIWTAKWLIKIIKKHKLGSAAITILILLAVDYALAWKNIKATARLLGIEV